MTFECAQCQKTYNTKQALKTHKHRKHRADKVVSCIKTKNTYALSEFERLCVIRYKNCINCGSAFWSKETRNKFCSRNCSAKHNNSLRTEYSSKTRQLISSSIRNQLKIISICFQCKETFTTVPTSHAKFCSRKCLNASNTKKPEKRKKSGGIRERSGRGKYGYYKGYWCQSTYEMAYVWKCLSLGKTISRNTEGFPYTNTNGEIRLFYPDFIVDGKYVEVKGWVDENVHRKITEFPYEIELLHGKEIKDIINEAKDHYGVKDLSSIYAENLKSKKNC